VVAPAVVVAGLAAAFERHARINHSAALRTKTHRRIGAAMIEILTGVGLHFAMLSRERVVVILLAAESSNAALRADQ